jgi:hypothetical protein
MKFEINVMYTVQYEPDRGMFFFCNFYDFNIFNHRGLKTELSEP